jgi:hypothetical protein
MMKDAFTVRAAAAILGREISHACPGRALMEAPLHCRLQSHESDVILHRRLRVADPGPSMSAKIFQ